MNEQGKNTDSPEIQAHNAYQARVNAIRNDILSLLDGMTYTEASGILNRCAICINQAVYKHPTVVDPAK